MLPVLSLPAQEVPAQQAGELGPHTAPALPQPQNEASTQKPPLPSEYCLQQPVSHCASVAHCGRQPAYAGFSEVTQPPLQQLADTVALPMHASPRFLHGLSQASLGLQIFTPVSWGSVQQPVSGQSVSLAQVIWHCFWPDPTSTQDAPSQQGLSAQPRPCATHNPASALGDLQPDTVLPASPVQKHEA